MKRALLVALALLSLSLAGCFGKDAGPLEVASNDDLLDDDAITQINERAAPVPKAYEFPAQELLEPKTLLLEGSVQTSAAAGYEDRNDRGGNSYNSVRETFDLKPHVPAGQPVEMRITLFFEGQPGASADVDILVDVPGTRTDRTTDNNDEFNWKFSVQRMVVNTIALADAPFEVGVQMSNGRSTAEWPYTLRVELNYPENVIAPTVPWGFRLPSEASGIVVSSEKAGGDEHVRAQLFVLDAEEQLVHHVEYDDLDIPTESMFLPLTGGREYVVYAPSMHGGFLRLEADVGVPEPTVVQHRVERERVEIASAPAAGVGARDWLHDGVVVTPSGGGETHAWSATRGFPLSIEPFIGGDGTPSTTAWSEIRATSSKGDVAWLQRVARHDDERGSLGYTQDAWNSATHPENLVRGDYTIWISDVSPGTPIGLDVLWLVRVE